MRRYGELPRGKCPVGCKGIHLGGSDYTGCGCPEGKLADGRPMPPNFICDCPNHMMSVGYDVGRFFGCLAVAGILCIAALGCWGAIVWVSVRAARKACGL